LKTFAFSKGLSAACGPAIPVEWQQPASLRWCFFFPSTVHARASAKARALDYPGHMKKASAQKSGRFFHI